MRSMSGACRLQRSSIIDAAPSTSINSFLNDRLELSELRQFIGVETPPQRLTDAEAHWQIARERASSDSLVQFRFYQLICAGWKRHISRLAS
jgi:hypothetical protein